MQTLFIALISIIAVIAFILGGLQWWFTAERIQLKQSPADFGLDTRQLWIPSKKGKRIFAWWIPSNKSNKTIIILHGWGSSSSQLLPLAVPFANSGMNVLLFDAHSHGHSDKLGVSSLPRFADDLNTVVNWFRKQYPDKSKSLNLVGHSVGAGAVLLEASRRPIYDRVISISAFAHPQKLMHRYFKTFYFPTPLINTILKYIQWVIGHKFSEIAPENSIKKIKTPVLIVHGEADTSVPVGDAKEIYAASNPKYCQLLIIKDAKHDSIEKIEEHGGKLVEFILPTKAFIEAS